MGCDSLRNDISGSQVVTSDFVAAMEEANAKSLRDFFAKWVYLRAE